MKSKGEVGSLKRIDKRWFALIVFSLLLSTGILAYNAGEIYSLNRSRVSALLPSDYDGGQKVSFPISVMRIDGEPLANKEVEVYLSRDDNSEMLYRGRTSQKGISDAEIELPEGNYQGDIIVKSAGKEISKHIEVRGLTRLFVSTDKPIYQPGQTVHIRSLCFVGSSPLNETEAVTYQITTPDGDKIFRKEFTPNEYGISYYNYTLSDILPLGAYELKVNVSDTTIKEMFMVDEYVLPRFKIDYRSVDDWYLFDDSVSGTLDVNYFFGKQVAGQAEVSLYYDGYEMDADTGQLTEGQFPFYLDLPYRNTGSDHFTLNATVTDTSGHKEWDTLDVPISEDPIRFDLISSKNIEGTKSTYTVKVSHPDGTPVADLPISASLGSTDLESKTTSASGIAMWEEEYQGESSFTVETDYDGENYRKYFKVESADGVKIVELYGNNEVGKNKEFQIYYEGTSLTGRIYYNVQTEKSILYSDYFILDESPTTITIPVVYDMSPRYRLNAYAIEKDMSYSTDSVSVNVAQSDYLDLTISTDKEIYRPAEETNIDFHVYKEGEPINAAIGVKITDEALTELNQLSGMDQILEKEDNETKVVGFEIVTAGQTYDSAVQVEQKWTSTYWSTLIILGFVGFLLLFVYAMNSKQSAACLMAGILIIGSFSLLIYGALPKGGSSGGDMGVDEEPQMRPEAREELAGDDAAAPGGGIGLDWSFGGKESSSSAPSGDRPTEAQGKPRTYFPETWYWHPTLITDQNGEANIKLITPDSITNWLVDGVASTKQGDMIGETENLTVFKDFFIEPDIPVSAVRGDTFELRVMVYNYLDTSVNAKVTLQGASWFELHDNPVKTVPLDSNEVGNVTYTITAEDVGENTLRIEANAANKQDLIHKKMKVAPNGQKEVQVFNGQLTNNETVTITFQSDSDYIPGSQQSFIKLYGGMDSVTLDSAEGFIHQVSGCGEQSMSTLSIDVLAYDIAVNSENPPENMEKYETIVTQGIQHELTFLMEAQNGKGRGIVWFTRDQDVHPWLTSWGLLTFQDARNAGLTIDDKIITDMQDWLVSQQNSDGSWEFPEWGLYETTSSTLRTKKVATTAYITRSLLYSGYDKSSSAVGKGLDYISNNIDDQWNDPYTLSIAAVCYKLANEGGSKYQSMLEQIDSLKKEKNGTVYWESDSSMLQDSRSYYGSSGSKVIETTGYALMALSGEGYYDSTDKAVQYLIENRNEFGTFYTTQDTVVALQALQTSTAGNIDMEHMNASVEMNGDQVGEVEYDQSNLDMTYFFDLKGYLSDDNQVTISGDGVGKLAYQVVYIEYIDWSIDEYKDIYLDVKAPSKTEVKDEYTLNITIRYSASAPYSKMGLVKIPLPTGFRTYDYEHLLERQHISDFEVEDNELRIYLTDLSAGTKISFDIDFIPSKPGNIQIQGIHYYDMYSPTMRVDEQPWWVEVQEG